MKKTLSIFIAIAIGFAQNPEIRKYKHELKTATGKERVDVINNLLGYRNVPEFRNENKKLAREAIVLADSLKYAEGRVDSWVSMAFLHTDTDSIKNYVEKADLVSDAIGYQKGIAKVLQRKAGVDNREKNYLTALEKAKKAERVFNELSDKPREAGTLNQIAGIYYSMGDFGTSLDYRLRAMETLSSNKESSIYRSAMNGAGVLYRDLERPRKSLSISLKLIDESLVYGDSTNFSNGLYHTSGAYRKLGILDSAVIYSKKVLGLDIELNNHDFILSDYSLIGDIYFEMNQLDSALAMYKKTEKIILEDKKLSLNQKINFTTKNTLDIGSIYLKQGRTQKSLPYLQEGLALAKKHKFKSYMTYAHRSLFDLYEKDKNYKKALEHHKAHIAYKDTLTGQEAQNKLANLEMQKEVSRGEAERSVLEQKAQIQDLEISKQKTIRNAFASVAFLIVALGWALVHNIRVRNRTLEKENKRKQEELEAAMQLQLSMLPSQTPETDSYTSAASMKVAETVGGDYYDFFQQDDGSIYIICGDATGHGMAAGMVVSMTKTGLETISSEAPNTLLKKLNETITKMNTGRNQMALTVAKLNGDELEFSSAAMPPTYLYRQSDKSLNELSATGLPLGAMKKETYDLAKEQMKEGDVLVMLSDGLPERVNTDAAQLDYPAVEECVKANAHKTPEEIIKELESLGDSFADGEPNPDDITIVVVKKK